MEIDRETLLKQAAIKRDGYNFPKMRNLNLRMQNWQITGCKVARIRILTSCGHSRNHGLWPFCNKRHAFTHVHFS